MSDQLSIGSPDASKLPQHIPGWIKREDDHLFYDGMVLLCAVPVCYYGGQPERGWYYEYAVVHVACDEHYFSLATPEGDGWGWEIEDVDYYLILKG